MEPRHQPQHRVVYFRRAALVSSAEVAEPFSDLSHDFVDLERLQKGRFLFQLCTPGLQNRVHSRLLVIAFINNLLDGHFPFLKTHQEAMAVVGLSWVLATVLGALPFIFSGTKLGTTDEKTGQPVPMTIVDALFESQSGFSTTGATVISDLENFDGIDHCILFWRSTTHFLGGLGILVLFVAILGQGSAGKALMRAEMPGPTKEGSEARMQHTAWVFAGMYLALNAILAVILMIEGMSAFDAICHAFATMATGGFSNYNGSIGHFSSVPRFGTNAVIIEYTIIIFMVLAGTNFTLLYLFFIRRQAGKLFADIEWRVYVALIIGITFLIVLIGYVYTDFCVLDERGEKVLDENGNPICHLSDAIRYSLFQVVAIITTTGFSTDDFDAWNNFGRGTMLLLMFVGGCAGSTGGGMKVIRHIMFLKILNLEIEQAYHPTVVRPVRIGGQVVETEDLRKNILVYFALVLAIFMFSWVAVIVIDPAQSLEDSASMVAATLNNIGPGLGEVGSTQDYGQTSAWNKVLFIILMMLGRLELFSTLVLFVPGFWRTR